MKKELLQYILISFIISFFAVFFADKINFNTDVYVGMLNTPQKRSVIIDAGHGGMDGGAVSVTGSVEKELNLSVSLTVREILHLLGYNVIMTRETDTELTAVDGGSRKMQDLKGRLNIACENNDAPFISIHMNKFSAEKYSGLQTYYSANDPNSSRLASAVQDSIKQLLQPNNEREIKASDSGIYLLQEIRSPAILIECGFLSNHNEATLLDDEVYRTKLSTIIATSVNLWYNNRE